MADVLKNDRIVVPIYKRIKIKNNLFLYKLIDFVIGVDIYDDVTDTVFYPKKNRRLYAMDDQEYTATDDKYCYGEFYDESVISLSFNEEDRDKAIEKYMESLKGILKFGFFDIDEEYLKIVDVETDKMLGSPLDPDSWEFYMSYDSASNNDVVTIPLTTIDAVINCINDKKFEDAKYFLESVVDDVATNKELIENSGNEPADYDTDMDMESFDDFSIKTNKANKLSEAKLSDELDDLIGMENIKEEVKKLTNYLKFVEKTKGYTNLDNMNLNMAFYGNPGTGKTTVARIIAKKLYELGYTKSDKFLETTARDFIAGYLGQTALKTKKILESNKGGVIFIDEAYIFSSKNNHNSDYAHEAIVEILKELEKKETIFIFAGYKDEMIDFVEMNPGLKSRIGYHLDFKDYSLDELYQIFTYKIGKYGLKIGEGLEDRVKAIFSTYKNKERFSNGRFVDNLIQKLILNHADRTALVTDIEILTTLESDDIVESDLKEILSKNKQKKIKGFGE